MPKMRATFANAGELCQQSGHFYFKKEGHGEAIPKPTVLNVSSMKNAEKLWCFPQQMKKRIILLLYSQL